MITLQHLTVSYGSRTILGGLDATFADGRITAVMGPNGCGKTTLLRCIGGLLTPTAGSVLLDGKPVADYPARALAQRVAFVRQQSQTDLEFSSFDIVLMGRNPWQRRLENESQADRNIVEHAMHQTGTWHLRNAKPAQMSGGELQRVMIARALAQQTPILLMDEPVSNLDIAHQRDIMRLMRSLSHPNDPQHQPVTTLVVIHDLNLALQFCDDLMLLHDGTTLFHGSIAKGLTPERVEQVYNVRSHLSEGRILFDY